MRQGQHRLHAPSAGSLRAIGRRVHDCVRDRSGSSVIVFSLSFAVLMFVTAMAIDYGRAELERMHMQRALDAAALAAAHQLGQEDQ